MRTLDQYVLRVLGDQWTAPSRTPTLLDVSRRGELDGSSAKLSQRRRAEDHLGSLDSRSSPARASAA
jgi:hypothetical protein